MVYIQSVIKTEVYAALNINFEVYAVCSKLLIIVQVFTKVLFAVSQQELIYHAIIKKCPILAQLSLNKYQQTASYTSPIFQE